MTALAGVPWPASLAALAAALPGYDAENLAVEVAREFIVRSMPPSHGEEQVPIAAALGRILAEDQRSPRDVPPHDNAAMDGYAMRFDDAHSPSATGGLAEPVELALRGARLAGDGSTLFLQAGECCRITTGATLPSGADTVVPQELVQRVPSGDGERIRMPRAAVHRGQHVRRAGEDVRRGDVALAAGQRLSPFDLGLLASLGLAQLPVRPQVRVAVFTTGNELVEPGQALPPGGIHDSNRPMFVALLRQMGAEALDLGIVRDEPTALEAALRDGAARADLVISCGGVGAGDADHTFRVASRLGDAVSWKLAMRPGRPMVMARLPAPAPRAWVPHFGLPGNPVAAAVAFLVLVQAGLRTMQGERWVWPSGVPVGWPPGIAPKPGRREFLRAALDVDADGVLKAQPAGDQGSAMLTTLARAEALVDLGVGDAAAARALLLRPQL